MNHQTLQLSLIENLDRRGKNGCKYGLYQCECGATKEIKIESVMSGVTKTCGNRSIHHNSNYRHGLWRTPEYKSWQAMKDRTLNPLSKDYSRYHKYGISENLANSFEAFFAEVGNRPTPKHSIDRVDTTKGYVEGNLKWSTVREQNMNKLNSYRVIIDGIEYSSTYEAAEKLGKGATTITRWTDGFFDKRRDKYTPPKKGCFRELKYS